MNPHFPSEAEKRAASSAYTREVFDQARQVGRDAREQHIASWQYTEDLRLGRGQERLEQVERAAFASHKHDRLTTQAKDIRDAGLYKDQALSANLAGKSDLALTALAKHDIAASKAWPRTISAKRLADATALASLSKDKDYEFGLAKRTYSTTLVKELAQKQALAKEATQSQQHRPTPFQAAQNKSQGHTPGQEAKQEAKQVLDRVQTAVPAPNAEQSGTEKAFLANLKALKTEGSSMHPKSQDAAAEIAIRDMEAGGEKGASANRILEGTAKFREKDKAFAEWQKENKCKSLADIMSLDPQKREAGMKLANAAAEQRQQVVEMGQKHEQTYGQNAERTAEKGVVNSTEQRQNSVMDSIRAIRDQAKEKAQAQAQTHQQAKKHEQGQAQ